MKNIRVLVTGGAGFIGSYLADALFTLGAKVTCVDSLQTQIHGLDPLNSPMVEALQAKAKLVPGDIRDRRLMKLLLEDADIVIHLAAETGTGQSMYEIERYFDSNVLGSAVLMESVLNTQKKPKRLIVASSRAVYGEGKYFCEQHGVSFPASRSIEALNQAQFEHSCPQCGQVLASIPTDEDSAIQPSSLYGTTKFTQESMVMISAKSMGIEATTLRFQNVYGPRQSLTNPYTGLLAVFANQFVKNLPVNVFEDGKETRDFVYVTDVVDSIILAVTSSTSGEIYNIGSGVHTSILNVASLMKKIYQSQSEIKISHDFRVGDIRHNCADIARAQKNLNFVPKVKFHDGLELFCNWTLTQKIDSSAIIHRAEQELKRYGLSK